MNHQRFNLIYTRYIGAGFLSKNIAFDKDSKTDDENHLLRVIKINLSPTTSVFIYKKQTKTNATLKISKAMNSLIIESTNHTPKVQFNTTGELSIKGKSLPEDTATFYAPLLNWISECSLDTIRFSFQLEYMNSSSANQISKLLLTIRDNVMIKDCTIDWHYEADDEDNYDFGKELEIVTDFKFNFFEYAEA